MISQVKYFLPPLLLCLLPRWFNCNGFATRYEDVKSEGQSLAEIPMSRSLGGYIQRPKDANPATHADDCTYLGYYSQLQILIATRVCSNRSAVKRNFMVVCLNEVLGCIISTSKRRVRIPQYRGVRYHHDEQSKSSHSRCRPYPTYRRGSASQQAHCALGQKGTVSTNTCLHSF